MEGRVGRGVVDDEALSKAEWRARRRMENVCRAACEGEEWTTWRWCGRRHVEDVEWLGRRSVEGVEWTKTWTMEGVEWRGQRWRVEGVWITWTMAHGRRGGRGVDDQDMEGADKEAWRACVWTTMRGVERRGRQGVDDESGVRDAGTWRKQTSWRGVAWTRG